MIWQRFARVSLCLLLFLFISVFLFINCSLINARWYIYFGLYIISTCLVLVPLFSKIKGVYDCYTIGIRLFVCSLIIERYLFRDESPCIFNYLVLSPFVFLIKFVTLLPSFAKTGLQSDNQVAVIKEWL